MSQWQECYGCMDDILPIKLPLSPGAHLTIVVATVGVPCAGVNVHTCGSALLSVVEVKGTWRWSPVKGTKRSKQDTFQSWESLENVKHDEALSIMNHAKPWWTMMNHYNQFILHFNNKKPAASSFIIWWMCSNFKKKTSHLNHQGGLRRAQYQDVVILLHDLNNPLIAGCLDLFQPLKHPRSMDETKNQPFFFCGAEQPSVQRLNVVGPLLEQKCSWEDFHNWVFPKIGVFPPKWMVYNGKPY